MSFKRLGYGGSHRRSPFHRRPPPDKGGGGGGGGAGEKGGGTIYYTYESEMYRMNDDGSGVAVRANLHPEFRGS